MKCTLSLAVLALAVAPEVRSQNFLDLLRTLQTPATNVPAPVTNTVVISNTQTVIIYTNNAAAQTPPSAPAAAAAPTLDTRPAFMQVITNYVLKTNLVIVTNQVVVTNSVVKTNFFNAQGVLLQPVEPPALPPGAVPIPAPAASVAQTPPAAATNAAPAPTGPDPAVVRSNQLAAVKEILFQGVGAASNRLSAAGAFAKDPTLSIPLPEGVTVFDRKKGDAFQAALNTAAQQAVVETLGVVRQAASNVKSQDPGAILKSTGDAATRHLFTSEEASLTERTLPIVQRAAVEARVREAYQAVMLRGGGLFGAVLGSGGGNVDTDAYLTRRVLETIRREMAQEEALLRGDASARKSKLLQEQLKP